ncbi:hypothetical protein FRC07_007776 [Ceratobasidium sp. 392]|nr:hypothetical protein FRC07_007776 [Ceratobasidium sp. 392]
MKFTAILFAAFAATVSVSTAAVVPCNLGQMEAEKSFWQLAYIRLLPAIAPNGQTQTSGCAITITGGTEEGHPYVGPYSHSAGYRVDLRKNTCLTNYIHTRFKKIGNRKDGRPQWMSKAGNIYCDEGNHWDALRQLGYMHLLPAIAPTKTTPSAQCWTIDNLITLKKASHCEITITGGTEIGHPRVDDYPHEWGYRADPRKSACLSNYIHNAFQKISNRPSDGRSRWRSKAGNIHTDEGNHWDAVLKPSDKRKNTDEELSFGGPYQSNWLNSKSYKADGELVTQFSFRFNLGQPLKAVGSAGTTPLFFYVLFNKAIDKNGSAINMSLLVRNGTVLLNDSRKIVASIPLSKFTSI